jgi:hypothetical protein
MPKEGKMRIRFILWDWKGSPNLEKVNDFLREVYNGKNAPSIVEVTTGGDSGTAVVCSGVIDAKEAQKIYNRFKRCGDSTTPYNVLREI